MDALFSRQGAHRLGQVMERLAVVVPCFALTYAVRLFCNRMVPIQYVAMCLE